MYNVHMISIRFEWEPRKASANLKKHGVSFEEAKSVFYDESAKFISDPDHSEDEERFILLGLSHALRVILVCHCYRSEGNVIRIISARKATPKEFKSY
ncbi:MAG: BrnT family toxin [Candidatus Nitrotoga sp.]